MDGQMITDVHGIRVRYDKSTERGIYYLKYDLSPNEAKVIIEYARNHGQAEFEDDQDRDYTLVKGADGTYTLVLRQETSRGGWF
jgi:hypothetical protein